MIISASRSGKVAFKRETANFALPKNSGGDSCIKTNELRFGKKGKRFTNTKRDKAREPQVDKNVEKKRR
jgi:hypothetical protein